MTTVEAGPRPAEVLFARLGYEPNPAQRAILDCPARFVLVAGGAQAGKSLTASKFLLKRMLDDGERALYWLVAADYERTRAEFTYLLEDFIKLGLLRDASKRIDPGFIELIDGTRIETKSATDPRRLAMRGVNGILGCEASQLDLATYHRLHERVAPKRGWVLLSGTLESSLGWYPQLLAAWRHGKGDSRSFSLPTPSNTALFPGGVSDPEILRLKEASSDEFFLERIMGQAVPPTGLVFPQFNAALHIQPEARYQPGETVYLWIDPGYGDSSYAVEVAQIVDERITVFDEIYERGMVTEDIIKICQDRLWWREASGAGIVAVADVYAKQHHGMPAITETWLKVAGLRLTTNKVGINEGIERLRGFLKPDPITGAPKIVFSPACQGILSEFGAVPNPHDGQTKAYRWGVDRQGNTYGKAPADEYNHGIKAVIYGLVARYGFGISRSVGITMRRWGIRRR